jgi:hypothetical protein
VHHHHHQHRVLPRLTLSCKYGLAHESISVGFVTCYVHQRLVKRKFLLNQFICSSTSSKFYLSLTWKSGSKYKILIQTFENIYRIYEMLKTVYENKALSFTSLNCLKDSRLSNWCRVNYKLTGRWLVWFFMNIWEKRWCARNLFQSVSQIISCNAGEVPPGEAWHGDQPPTLFIWSCTSKLLLFPEVKNALKGKNFRTMRTSQSM